MQNEKEKQNKIILKYDIDERLTTASNRNVKQSPIQITCAYNNNKKTRNVNESVHLYANSTTFCSSSSAHRRTIVAASIVLPQRHMEWNQTRKYVMLK